MDGLITYVCRMEKLNLYNVYMLVIEIGKC